MPLQVSVAKQFTKGLSVQRELCMAAFQSTSARSYATWIKRAQKGRDDSQREQQLGFYG